MNDEHVLNIIGRLTGDHGNEQERTNVRILERQLDDGLKRARKGQCEGHEFGAGEFQLFLRGASADDMLDVVQGSLAKKTTCDVRSIVRRYGPAGSRESTIDLVDGTVTSSSEVRGRVVETQKLVDGSVFLVPLMDRSFGVGQITARENVGLPAVTVALFDWREAGDGLTHADWLRDEHLVSCQFVTPELLGNSTWPIVSRNKVAISKRFRPFEETRRNGWIGAEIRGSAIVRSFLEAYHCLRAWDGYADPAYFDKMLIETRRRPVNAIITK
jgi:hypothetical protein